MAMRLLDLADGVDRGRPFAVGPFMSPFARQIGQTIAAHMKTVKSSAFGGYHEAERVRIAFCREDYDGPVDYGESLLSVTWDGRYRIPRASSASTGSAKMPTANSPGPALAKTCVCSSG